jgi:prepilin-type N-terminal cleavage/methylation domain-containing protein
MNAGLERVYEKLDLHTANPHRKAHHFRGAFSLIELLIAIGIFGVIAALLLPAVTRVRESARRATDLTNLRQLVAATVLYASDYNGELPAGRVSFAPPGADNYLWLSYKNCWQPLVARSPALSNIVSCGSVASFYADSDDFGKPGSEYGWSDDTQVGWVYWGGRDDLVVGGTLKYRSMRRFSQHLTPSSQTLWTCLCWDSAGVSGSSVCPHLGAGGAMYPLGMPLKPAPDGLGVALDDGSAAFVKWDDLVTIPQANGYKIYYQP